MPQINTTPIRITNKKMRLKKRVPRSGSPGSDINPISSMGFGGIDISARCYATSLYDYNDIMEELNSGAFKFYVRDGWYYNTILADLDKSDDVEGASVFPFNVKCITEEPYEYSDEVFSSIKTLSSIDQTWSTDDSGDAITSFGNVVSKPTITVTGAGWGAVDKVGKQISDNDATVYNTSSDSYVLKKTYTLDATGGKHHITNFAADMQCAGGKTASLQLTVEASSLYGGVETAIHTFNSSAFPYESVTTTLDITGAENEQMILRLYLKTSVSGNVAYYKNSDIDREYLRAHGLEDLILYNDDDDTIQTDVLNELYPDQTFEINPRGIGTFAYTMDLSDVNTDRMEFHADGATLDTGNTKYTLTASGFIEFGFDTRYSITGIPILSTNIDILTGTPTIQIAEDVAGVPGTWYDIDTAVVDAAETAYNLVSGSDVRFKGNTKIWVRIETNGGTLDMSSFYIGADIIAEDAAFFYINKNGVSTTLHAIQGADSSGVCIVTLEFNNRRFVNGLG